MSSFISLFRKTIMHTHFFFNSPHHCFIIIIQIITSKGNPALPFDHFQKQIPTSQRTHVAWQCSKGCSEHSLATAATRYPQVEGSEAGRPLGSISWMKMQPIIRAENRCFQQRALHHYGPVGNEGKYQGPGILRCGLLKAKQIRCPGCESNW